MITNDTLIGYVVKVIPYPDQIVDWDTTSELSAIRFTWRSSRFRVAANLSVEEVDDCVLAGSNSAILLEALLKKGG